MESTLPKIDYKKWLSPETNTPTALEGVIIDQIMQRYGISKAKAFAIISNDYKRDNISLGRLSIALYLSKYNYNLDSITTNRVKKLDNLVSKILKVSHTRPKYLGPNK